MNILLSFKKSIKSVFLYGIYETGFQNQQMLVRTIFTRILFLGDLYLLAPQPGEYIKKYTTSQDLTRKQFANELEISFGHLN